MQLEKLLTDNHIGANLLDNIEGRGWVSMIVERKCSYSNATGRNRYLRRCHAD